MSNDAKKSRAPLAAARARGRAAWLVAGGSVAALLVALALLSRGGMLPDHHPVPRDAGERPETLAPADFASHPRVAESYGMALAVPEILDGLYCYCHCAEHSGHHSLLDCFASEHAAHCDVCMSEAAIAYRMAQRGATLDQIREAVDRMYRS